MNKLLAAITQTAQELMRNPNLSQVPKFYKELALYVENEQVNSSKHMFFAEPADIIGTKFPGLSESEIATCFEYLHSIGVVVLHKRSGFVCTRPHLIAKIMTLFVGSEFTGTTTDSRCAILPKTLVVERLNNFLRSINELPLEDPQEQAHFFDMLERLELCIPLSANMQQVYGQEGLLFPAIRPLGDVFVMPEQSYMSAMGLLFPPQQPLKWIARMWMARGTSIPLELFCRVQVQAALQSSLCI